MSDRVNQILKRWFWTKHGRKCCLEAIKALACAFDREYGAYPEHEFEGLQFYCFCLGKEPSDDDLEDARAVLEFDKKRVLDEPDIPSDTPNNTPDVEKD